MHTNYYHYYYYYLLELLAENGSEIRSEHNCYMCVSLTVSYRVVYSSIHFPFFALSSDSKRFFKLHFLFAKVSYIKLEPMRFV